MSKIKEYLKFKVIGVVLSRLKEKEAYELGYQTGTVADEAADKHLGNKKSEKTQAESIFVVRAFVKGYEDATMKDMNQKQRDILNQFKKEV